MEKRRVPSLTGATSNDFSSLIVTVDALSPRGKAETPVTIDACAQRTKRKERDRRMKRRRKKKRENASGGSNFAKSLAFEVSRQVTNKRFYLLSWRSAIVQIGKTARQSVLKLRLALASAVCFQLQLYAKQFSRFRVMFDPARYVILLSTM